ncbi:hypothetical protein ACFSSC_02065 [Corynebacterium mendelii]|uniref:Uncharacterized protein n=1 Tax=Corynebacterium mendelii TaxID=2765362 RepID=A0A939DZT9_9CORY|nr:hypothetical protein [Corynebacterium mendelii]MBN9644068.1 hypothetical protein [Corynebacterium mendelii]
MAELVPASALRGMSTRDRVNLLAGKLRDRGVTVMGGDISSVPGDGAAETSLRAVDGNGAGGGISARARSGVITDPWTIGGVSGAGVVPVPPPLAGLFPGGGLPRRKITVCGDCPGLVVEFIAEVIRDGGYVAVVGWPGLVYAQLVEYGLDLEHLVLVPDPGAHPLSVVAVLAEGMDLVVHHAAGGTPGTTVSLSPTAAGPLTAKMRRGTAAVVVVAGTVPSRAVSIDAQVTGYSGIGCGTGRIAGVSLHVAVAVTGRAPVGVDVTVGAGGVSVGGRSGAGQDTDHRLAVG